MRIIKEKVRLTALATLSFCLFLTSLLNYADQPTESRDEITARVLRDRYHDFYYWMEALSRAPLMLVEDDYSEDNAPLTLDDLKRIYNLSFTASHLVDPIYFSLRNAYYSASYQDGKPFNMETLNSSIKWQHQQYLEKLHEMHKSMSPYFDGALQEGKTFAEVNQEVLIPAYEESYNAYKQWMVQYAPEEKTYDHKLGQQRAEQWLRFEIADRLLAEISLIIYQMDSQKKLETCLYPEETNQSLNDQCLEAYAVHSAHKTAEQYLKHPLLKRLMPNVFSSLSLIRSKSVHDLHTNPATLLEFRQHLETVISRDQPPYGLAYFTGMDLHKFSSLSLERLETLKANIQHRRQIIANRAITPEIAIYELGLTAEVSKPSSE